MKYKNQSKYLLFSFLFLFLLHGTETRALVSIQNGNYFVSFVDIAHLKVGNQESFKVNRVYNSLSQYDGIFGYGWGSSFESFLVVAVDGSVVIRKSGGGEQIRFVTNVKRKGLEYQIKKIVTAKSKAEKGNPSFNQVEYTKKLRSNVSFRDEEGRNFKISANIPVGKILKGNFNGNKQAVEVIRNGFLQKYNNGRKVYFTKKSKVSDFGVNIENRRILDVYKVTRIENPKKGVYINITYNEQGHIIKASSGSQFLLFDTNSDGKIVRIQNARGQIARYEYCSSKVYSPTNKCAGNDLVKSTDPNGNIYSYKYDVVHNLIEIRTQSAKLPSMDHVEKISYWPLSPPGNGRVKQITYRTGLEMHYTYWESPTSPKLHFKRTIKTVRKSGRPSIASYEYWRKERSDGSLYKYQTESIVRGVKTRTSYNQCCDQPIRIEKGKNITTFSYYKGSNLLKERADQKEKKLWKYSRQHFGKPSKITIVDKMTKKITSVNFLYYKDGNVKRVQTSNGESIAVAYDIKGRMNVLVDHKKRKITLKYNELSRPSIVEQVGVGAIRLTYDKNGKVKDFKIHEGSSKAAFGIAYAFQDALKIIKFAGIEPI